MEKIKTIFSLTHGGVRHELLWLNCLNFPSQNEFMDVFTAYTQTVKLPNDTSIWKDFFPQITKGEISRYFMSHDIS